MLTFVGLKANNQVNGVLLKKVLQIINTRKRAFAIIIIVINYVVRRDSFNSDTSNRQNMAYKFGNARYAD
jgi:hypothetical protein